MKIITANWREIRIQCECGNVIAAPLNALRVQCQCGREAYLAELRDKKLDERKPNGKLDRYLA